jgi:hypothetical protein
VGFDDTLELRVEIQVPSELSSDTPLGLRVTGTIDEPRIGVAADQPELETGRTSQNPFV